MAAALAGSCGRARAGSRVRYPDGAPPRGTSRAFRGVAATERWITLPRWLDAIEAGRLLDVVVSAGLRRRGVAERAAHVLAARAGSVTSADPVAAAFDGATAAA